MANTDSIKKSRYRLIESLLFWEGQVTNDRLRDLLGIQSVQASRILFEYKNEFPDQLQGKHNRSPFFPTDKLEPINCSGSVDEYIALTRDHEESRIIYDVRADLTTPRQNILSQVALAIRNKVGVEILYESMTHPEGKNRIIFPHAIVRAGRRWHLRAWDNNTHDFRDFVLGRVKRAELTTVGALHLQDRDAGWMTWVPIRLTAHKDLTADQCRVIRNEYFDGAASRSFKVRSCLVQYTLQDIRAAVDQEKELPPEYQLAVVNLEEIRPLLFG